MEAKETHVPGTFCRCPLEAHGPGSWRSGDAEIALAPSDNRSQPHTARSTFLTFCRETIGAARVVQMPACQRPNLGQISKSASPSARPSPSSVQGTQEDRPTPLAHAFSLRCDGTILPSQWPSRMREKKKLIRVPVTPLRL